MMKRDEIRSDFFTGKKEKKDRTQTTTHPRGCKQMDRKKRPSETLEVLGKRAAKFVKAQDSRLSDGDEQKIMHRPHDFEVQQVELALENAELERKVSERTAELTLAVAALENEIEDRRQTEAALRKSQRQLRELSRQILDAQENERKLIAQNIHDSISGSLAAIKLAVEEKIDSMGPKPAIEASWLETIISYLDETIKESRRISAHLRPSLLDDLGLLPTVSWFCREFEQLHASIQIEQQLDVAEAEIPEMVKVIVYRVLQESMNNVAKHSGATRVRLQLVKTGNRIEFCVADNGCGFDSAEKFTSSVALTGYGLSGMRDRTLLGDGKFEISSEKGKGTKVHISLPFSADVGGGWR
jgi:signal transduction histidine kinase